MAPPRNKRFERLCVLAGLIGAAILFSAPSVRAAKPSTLPWTPKSRLDALQNQVGAQILSVENSEALRRTETKLRKGEPVRVLHLGDSHVASDYITGMIRHRLQERWGSGGRGFVHPDQSWGYGGRKLSRKAAPWIRGAVVDRKSKTTGPDKPYGFSGIALESKKKGASVTYLVLPEDRTVRIDYQQRPGAPSIVVRLGKTELTTIQADGPVETKTLRIPLPDERGAAKKSKRHPPGWRLSLIAQGAKARIYGLSFEAESGVIYDSVGPLGGDAKVYTQMDAESFRQHLSAHAPDMVVLMVGGNDAYKIRRGWTNLSRVRVDHRNMVARVREALPDAELLLWGPMDAGTKKRGQVQSAAMIPEVRNMQQELAKAEGFAFWDTFTVMGGPGAIQRWHRARVINKDLVHPKKSAADLLGRLLVQSWLDATE